MSNEQKGILSRRVEGTRTKWRLDWEFGGKKYFRDGIAVERKVDDSIRFMDEARLATLLPMDVVFRLDKFEIVSIQAADAGVKQAAEAEKAASKKDGPQVPKAVADRKAAAGEAFPLPPPWTRPTAHDRHFHNPYSFVPTPAGTPKAGNGLDHHRPKGHHAYHPGHYTGRLTVEIETVTPLVIGDTSRGRPDKDVPKHLIVPPLTRNGEPVLPITSFKGALRSAYEAITVSRMGVFTGHDELLGRRMAAGEGLAMIPARVTDDGKDVELLMGKDAPTTPEAFRRARPAWNEKSKRWDVPSKVMYAAWLPTYQSGRGSNPNGPVLLRQRVTFRNGRPDDPEHMAVVSCSLRKVRHKNYFSYWRVEEIVPGRDLAALSANPPRSLQESDRQQYTNDPPIRVVGWVCRTGQNFGRKHDERVFFVPEGSRPYPLGLSADRFGRLAKEWKRLVEDYRDQAETARRGRNGAKDWAYLGNDPGKTAFSRHVYAKDALDLTPGTLGYALYDTAGNLKGLYPVMIARELGAHAPEVFLPENVRPATTIDQLSPADRVFGWVKPDGSADGGRNMVRGQLRIRSLAYVENKDGNRPLADFSRLNGGRGLPLAILSTPKPSQARFYLAADRAGSPLPDGQEPAEAFYVGDPARRSLRGRKVYPHHRHTTADTAAYWNGPAAVENTRASVRGLFREFVRPNKVTDDQNRSIGGWVTPKTVFRAEIDVVNLSAVELGALLWLLTDGKDAEAPPMLRLGYGKPLGFGSVKVTVTRAEIETGEAIAAGYGSLVAPPAAEPLDLDALLAAGGPVDAYRTALAQLFGNGSTAFDDLPVIKAWRIAAAGFPDGLPVHYPRARPPHQPAGQPVPPNEEGKNFEWFVSNGSPDKKAGTRAPFLALPPLWAPVAMPLHPSKEKNG